MNDADLNWGEADSMPKNTGGIIKITFSDNDFEAAAQGKIL